MIAVTVIIKKTIVNRLYNHKEEKVTYKRSYYNKKEQRNILFQKNNKIDNLKDQSL